MQIPVLLLAVACVITTGVMPKNFVEKSVMANTLVLEDTVLDISAPDKTIQAKTEYCYARF